MRRPVAIIGILAASVTMLSCPGFTQSVLEGNGNTVELRVSDTTCSHAEVQWRRFTTTSYDEQSTHVDLPWSITFDGRGAQINLRARRECDDDGTVDVEIWVNQQLASRQEQHGPSAVAETGMWVN
jgi:hypothetical protein